MFTLLGQSLGSIYLAREAISKFIPGLFIGTAAFLPVFIGVDCPTVDTMGYAFTLQSPPPSTGSTSAHTSTWYRDDSWSPVPPSFA